MIKRSKKFIAILLAIALLVSAINIVSAFSVSAASADAQVGEAELKLKATSNLFPTYEKTFDSSTDTLTVTYYINSTMSLLSTQWELTYDPDVLQYDSAKNSNVNDFMPCLTGNGYSNPNPIDYETGELVKGKIYGNAANLGLDKLQSNNGSEIAFFTVTFDVFGKGDTNVDLHIDVMSFGEKKNNDVDETIFIDDGKIVDNNISMNNRTDVYSGLYIPSENDPSQPEKEGLDLTATSNYFPTYKQHFDASTDTVTVTYYLNSTKSLLQSQWSLTYDPTVLKYNRDKNSSVKDFMPCATEGTYATTTPINTSTGERIYGMICGSSTNLSLEKLQTSTGKKVGFVSFTFDVIGSGDTNVDLYLDVLTLANLDPTTHIEDDTTEEDILNNGVLCDHETEVLSDTLVYAGKYNSEPEITTEPSTTAPETTQPTTVPQHKYLYGDVNLNDEIAIADATLIQKYLSKFQTLSDIQIILADVSNDKEVTVKDATFIQKYIAKMNQDSLVGQPYYQ